MSKSSSNLTSGWFSLIFCTSCFWPTLQRFYYISLVRIAPNTRQTPKKRDPKITNFFYQHCHEKIEKSLKITSKLMRKMWLQQAAFRFEALWRPTWGPKGAQSCQKVWPAERLESALGTKGARVLPNAARGCPGPRKWSSQGSKRELKSQQKT